MVYSIVVVYRKQAVHVKYRKRIQVLKCTGDGRAPKAARGVASG